MHLSILALSLTALLSSAAPPAPIAAAFGPPLVCHELEIGDARSLPWKKGTGPESRYDRTRLVADVAEILKTEEDLVVRMETLRRAAIYAQKDRALAWELLGRRSLVLVEQASTGSKEHLAWFDAGVLVSAFDQLDVDLGMRAGVSHGFEGYAYLEKALERARAEKADQLATIEFAAALVAHPALKRGAGDQADLDRYWKHVDAAAAGVHTKSLLETNLAGHLERWNGYIGRSRG